MNELLKYLLKEKQFITKEMIRAEIEENKTSASIRYNQLVLIDRIIRKVYEILREQERKEEKAESTYEGCKMRYVLGGSSCEDCLSSICKFSSQRKEELGKECFGNFCAKWIVIGDEQCKKCNNIGCTKNPKNKCKDIRQITCDLFYGEQKRKDVISHENLEKYGKAIADGLKDGIEEQDEELVMSIKNRLKPRTQEENEKIENNIVLLCLALNIVEKLGKKKND